MKDIKWLVNRLKSMNPQEILWRVKQKILQSSERRNIYSLSMPVTNIPLQDKIACLHIDTEKIGINWKNENWSKFKKLDLFGIFEYDFYKQQWNAGFQTERFWPEHPFSPGIRISQRMDIGDIRTNWELNRHFQFSALAKTFYCAKDNKYFTELRRLFDDWNTHNLFLHGVEWASAMEISIRINSWVYMLCFLKKAGCDEKFLGGIEHGIFVMADYVLKHRSHYSSANNHLIIEMYAVALVGILTDYSPWRDEALKVLTEELPKQNYSDGVNKEMSLHYQSLVMEAYGLVWLLMEKNHIEIPQIWKEYLSAMTEFLADSVDDKGSVIEFGDSDEGKILDLNGSITSYYQYVLNLMSYLLGKKYTSAEWHENLNWIVPKELKTEKEAYIPKSICCRREGGYTLLRSKDKKILIGIDHAALGFGSIAAHGHADALSFQLFFDGKPFFVDPGTYSYHCGTEIRNAYRSTKNHNTVTVCGKDQSEILGPFLWGKRAESRLVTMEESFRSVSLIMEHNGFSPIIHRRKFDFDGGNELIITDTLSESCDYMANFLLAPQVKVKEKENKIYIFSDTYCCEVVFTSNDDLELLQRNAILSRRYGKQESTKAISITSHGRGFTTRMIFGSK